MYIGLALIVPLEPLPAGAVPATGADAEGHRHGAAGSGRWLTFFGIALVLLGSLALVGSLLPSIASWRYLGPVFIIGMGAVLVVGAMRRDEATPVTLPAAPVPPVDPPQEPTDS